MFISRKIMLPVTLAAAAGTPYLLVEEEWGKATTEQVQSFFAGEETSASEPASADPMMGVPIYRSEFTHGRRAQFANHGVDESLTGPAVQNLEEIFRFDLSADWIIQRWPRITTTTSENGLEGMRVPLVSGTRADDLAGSLTYYFDARQQIQRLSFEGYTGDASKLVGLVTTYYELQLEPSAHAGMYLGRWNGRVTSVMRVARPPIISAGSPNSRFQISMELNRPNASFGLSPAYSQMLVHDQQTGRW